MSKLPRIFFDTNEGAHGGGYWLVLDNSKADLKAMKLTPHEGLRVEIYMPDELEMEATLHWDELRNDWVAMPIPGTIKIS